MQEQTVNAMRNRLIAYRRLNEEIDYQLERLDRLQTRASSIGGNHLSGMPKAPSGPYDKIADSVARIVDLENEIKDLVRKRDEERRAIEMLALTLKNPSERAVIRSRYLDLEEWDDVQFVLFGSNEDYDSNFDDYKQKMYRWHRTAIRNMSQSNAP